MADNKPRVSIGMPVYNEEHFIRDTLGSLLSQSFKDFELIISDNASTDRTGEICLEYAAHDQRIRYYRTETNIGAIANFNRVFKMANAEYFFWASGHDMRHDTFISRCVELLDHDASIVLCYPMARWIEPDNKVGNLISGRVDTRDMGQLTRFNTLLWGLGICPYPIYGIIKSSALKETGLIKSVIGSDIVLLAELSLIGAFALVPEPLLYLRITPDQGILQKHLLKILGPVAHKRSATYMYLKWVCEFMRVVSRRRHGGNYWTRLALRISTILCLASKYRWLLDVERHR
jgi:glycosyltransferase involved in cell wall biosynthesis